MGPRFNGVEDFKLGPVAQDNRLLQWGHALMAWKTLREQTATRRAVARFNGATL